MAALPEEIIAEILITVPAKPLLRSKSVCKSWGSLISTPQFAHDHLNRASNYNHEHRTIVVLPRYINKPVKFQASLMLLPCDNDQGVKLEQLRLDDLSMRTDVDYWLDILGCCDGLICLCLRNTKGPDCIALWNPSTREWKTLPGSSSSVCHTVALCGIGYDSSIGDYKMVRAVSSEKRNYSGCPEMTSALSFDVFTMKTSTWRRIQGVADACLVKQRAEHLNGALHWLMIKKNLNPLADFDSYYCSPSILLFDLAEEEFKEICGPPDTNGSVGSTLGVLGDCLSVSVVEGGCIVLWVMKKYGVEESWTKLMSSQWCGSKFEYPGSVFPVCYSKNDEEVLTIVDGELVVYNLKEGTDRSLGVFGVSAAVYVESLVSPTLGLFE